MPTSLYNSCRWDRIAGMKKLVIFVNMVFLFLVAPAGLFAAAYDSLLPLLVDLAGWEAEAVEGIDLSQAGMQGVTVAREYSSGEKAISAAIILGSQVGITWTPEYQEGFKLESTEGSMEVRKLNGFLVYQVYNKENSSGGLVVLLIETTADKPESGAVFVFSFEGISFDEGLKLAQKFDWRKMKNAAGMVK